MNSNRRVLLFVVWSAGLLLLISIAGSLLGLNWLPFNRVNLIADIITSPDETPVTDTTIKDPPPLITETGIVEDFNLYNRPRLITDFNADTTHFSLNKFVKKLHELNTGQRKKVRIAYFGDSMIEGDLLTQTLRKLLQQKFGGKGVGFVPVTSPVSKFRQTAYADYSEGWEDENFKEGKNSKLFLSGHSFHTNGAWVQIRDQTLPADSVILEKSLLCGKIPGNISIKVNNQSFPVKAEKLFNRIVIGKNKQTAIRLSVDNDNLPVYGISFESESGIFVDNFSFRGISGIEFAMIDSAYLHSIADNNPYDLIVFQYGVNVLFRPNDKNFSWYSKAMRPVIRKMKNCFPESDFILVSTADRAFRYNGQYKSAMGIDSLIRMQALLAYESGSIFYNQFASMGGANSIVDWATRKPSLANQDYIHPNHRGAEVLAGYFFEAIISDYNKYLKKL
jgi:hypothetical protein